MKRRPYDREADVDVERYRRRAEAFAVTCKELGLHLGIAVERGPLECPTCETRWPCPHEKAR